MLSYRPQVRLLALLVAGGACAQSTLRHPLPAVEQERVARQLGGRRATVKVAPPAPPTGSGAAARNTLVLSGKTYLEQGMVRVVQKQEEHRVPVADVREVDANRVGMGALTGTGVGLLAGVVLGFLAGAASNGDCGEKDDRCLDRVEGGALNLIVFAPAGALLGLAVGAAMGAGPSYKFTPATP